MASARCSFSSQTTLLPAFYVKRFMPMDIFGNCFVICYMQGQSKVL